MIQCYTLEALNATRLYLREFRHSWCITASIWRSTVRSTSWADPRSWSQTIWWLAGGCTSWLRRRLPWSSGVPFGNTAATSRRPWPSRCGRRTGGWRAMTYFSLVFPTFSVAVGVIISKTFNFNLWSSGIIAAIAFFFVILEIIVKSLTSVFVVCPLI